MKTAEVLHMINEYNETSKTVIGLNIRNLLQKYTAQQIAEKTDKTIHTVYSWTKHAGNKPEFESAIKLCSAVGIEIEQLIK